MFIFNKHKIKKNIRYFKEKFIIKHAYLRLRRLIFALVGIVGTKIFEFIKPQDFVHSINWSGMISVTTTFAGFILVAYNMLSTLPDGEFKDNIKNNKEGQEMYNEIKRLYLVCFFLHSALTLILIFNVKSMYILYLFSVTVMLSICLMYELHLVYKYAI